MEPPKRITVNVPAVLARRLEERMKELKYRSASAYFVSLMLFDFYKRVPHLLTGTLHNERPEIQDQFYSEIERDFAQMGEHPPAWFMIRIQELVAEEVAKREERRQAGD